MVCKKCGATLKDDGKFCDICGANLSETVAEPATAVLVEEPVQEPETVVLDEAELNIGTDSPAVEEAYIAPTEATLPPKKKSSKAKVIVIIAVVIALLGGLAFFFRDALANMFVSMMPAEKQLQAAYQKTAEKWAEQSSQFIGNMKKVNLASATGKTEGTIAVELSEDILAQLLGTDLGDVNRVTLDYVLTQGADDMGIQLVLVLEDTQIVSGNIALDMEEGLLSVQVPELSEQALQENVDMDEFSDAMDEANQMMTTLQGALPSEEFVKTFLPKYMGVALQTIEEVEREKETIEVGDVSQKATVLRAVIDEGAIDKMGDAIVAELKEDAEFKKCVEEIYKAAEELSGEDFDESYDEIFDVLEDLFDELKDTDAVKDGIDFVTWVNSDNEVIGVQFGEVLSIASAEDGEKVAYEISALEDGEELEKLLVEGTEKKDVFAGTVKLYVQEENVLTIDVDKYTSTEDSFQCVASVELPDELIEEITGSSWMFGDIAVKLDMNSSKNSADTQLGILLNDENLATLEISGKYVEGAAKVDYPDDTTTDANAWAMTLDPTQLMENLTEAGISEDLLNTLIINLSYMMY